MEISQGVVDVDGLVTSVTASSPLSSSGGTTPNISLTGTVPVANGGTGTSTQFTPGSVVFAGASGIYSQDNANFFWDDSNNRLGVGTATPSAPIDLLKTGLGATASDVSGFLIMNTTAAAAGAQQVSPSITWEGQGWKTTATAASQAVRFQSFVLPVQGTTAPTGTWTLAAAVNSGAYGNLLEVESAGRVTVRNTLTTTATLRLIGSDGRTATLVNFGSASLGLSGGYMSTIDGGSSAARFGAVSANSVITFFQLYEDNTAGVMAQRTTTTAQAYRVYNTYTNSTNYERGVFDWQTTSNVLSIGTQAGGTGTVRNINFVGGNIGVGITSPTAYLNIKAGTATANTAPLKFTSGTLNTAAEAGAMEFLTDDYFLTITTGAARKGIVLDDGTRLTSGRVPFATTNGRLTDDADLTFATDTLTATKIVGTTSVKVGTAAGYISSDGSTGATGTFTTTDLKTVTVKDGIVTSIV